MELKNNKRGKIREEEKRRVKRGKRERRG